MYSNRTRRVISIWLSFVITISTVFISREIFISLKAAQLTDLFETMAFSGSWEVFSKMNAIGWLLSSIISVFCLVGLFLTCFRIIDSMLYLSGKNIFDTVDELKGKGKGQSFFGFGSMAKEVFHANYGVGLDAFVGFFLSLLPNIKAYSDYAEGNMSYNLSEDDTITTYILHISLPTILTIFFFSIGFSGTLWAAFGNVVGAMCVASETLVEVDLDQMVNRALNTGASYSFSLNGDQTEWGGFKQNLAKTMNNKILNKTVNLTSDVKMSIGAKVESAVNAISAEEIDTICNTSVAKSDRDAGKLKYSVVINNTKEYTNSSGWYKCYVASDLGFTPASSSEQFYIHVFITKEANTDETNYFEYNSEGKSDNTSGKPGGAGTKPGDTLPK